MSSLRLTFFYSVNLNKFLFRTPKFLFTDFDKICGVMQGKLGVTLFQRAGGYLGKTSLWM